jgi:hypothetical protein
MASLRLPQDILVQAQVRAKSLGVNMSQYIRNLIIQDLQSLLKGAMK